MYCTRTQCQWVVDYTQKLIVNFEGFSSALKEQSGKVKYLDKFTIILTFELESLPTVWSAGRQIALQYCINKVFINLMMYSDKFIFP